MLQCTKIINSNCLFGRKKNYSSTSKGDKWNCVTSFRYCFNFSVVKHNNFSLTEVRCKGSSGGQKTCKMVLSGGPAPAGEILVGSGRNFTWAPKTSIFNECYSIFEHLDPGNIKFEWMSQLISRFLHLMSLILANVSANFMICGA